MCKKCIFIEIEFRKIKNWKFNNVSQCNICKYLNWKMQRLENQKYNSNGELKILEFQKLEIRFHFDAINALDNQN